MSSDGKVIKPPIEEVKSGKVFKPSKAFRNKNWVLMISIALGIWVTFISIMLGIGYLAFGLIGQSGFQGWIDVFWNVINPWYWLLTAVWFIPAFILYPIYINAFEYSVIAESGETMPEIYVKKGLINITRKHVPL
ncbi:MAG: hypothetical protein ACFFAX_01980, partial [Promethearchaeota archaeon]